MSPAAVWNSGAVPIVLLGAAVALGIYMGPAWDPESRSLTRTVMEGVCRAEIEGRATSCNRSVDLLRVAGDALSMFTFMTRDRIIGVAGERWEPKADGLMRLEVDRVDLGPPRQNDETFTPAQGECLVQTRGGLAGPFAVVECTAQPLGRGQRLRFRLDRITRFESDKI